MSEKEAVFMGQAAEVIVEQLVLALVGLAAYFLLSWNSE